MRMQRIADVLLEKQRQPFAAAGVEGLCGKILQDLLRVVGLRKKARSSRVRTRRWAWVAPEITSTPNVAPMGMAAFEPAAK